VPAHQLLLALRDAQHVADDLAESRLAVAKAWRGQVLARVVPTKGRVVGLGHGRVEPLLMYEPLASFPLRNQVVGHSHPFKLVTQRSVRSVRQLDLSLSHREFSLNTGRPLCTGQVVCFFAKMR
jgi:hypothetical protein